MPCINFPIEELGPVLEIGISTATTFQDAGKTAPIHWAKAIADTGCTVTSIHTDLATKVGLKIIGKRNVDSTTHTVPVNLYFGNLFLKWTLLNGTTMNMAFVNQPFLELKQCSDRHEALLGMNVLGMGLFSVNGTRKEATFCW